MLQFNSLLSSTVCVHWASYEMQVFANIIMLPYTDKLSCALSLWIGKSKNRQNKFLRVILSTDNEHTKINTGIIVSPKQEQQQYCVLQTVTKEEHWHNHVSHSASHT